MSEVHKWNKVSVYGMVLNCCENIISLLTVVCNLIHHERALRHVHLGLTQLSQVGLGHKQTLLESRQRFRSLIHHALHSFWRQFRL